MKKFLLNGIIWAAVIGFAFYQCSPTTRGSRRDGEFAGILANARASEYLVDVDCGTGLSIDVTGGRKFRAVATYAMGHELLKAIWNQCGRKRSGFDKLVVRLPGQYSPVATFTPDTGVVLLDR
jgi:hypothetical protein